MNRSPVDLVAAIGHESVDEAGLGVLVDLRTTLPSIRSTPFASARRRRKRA